MFTMKQPLSNGEDGGLATIRDLSGKSTEFVLNNTMFFFISLVTEYKACKNSKVVAFRPQQHLACHMSVLKRTIKFTIEGDTKLK